MRGGTTAGCVGLGLALALALAGCAQVPVVQGVPEVEANRVVAVLDQAGVAARKEADEGGGSGAPTFRVDVGPDEVAHAAQVLHAHALPRREEAGFAETYGAASMVQSASEERARAAQAVAGELSRSIERIDGVLDARVHVSLPDAREALDGTPAPRPSASVLVRYTGARAPYDEDALRRLVVGAVAGMRPEDVAVVGIAAPPAPAVTEARLAWVGPIAVARGSLGALRALLGASVAVNVVLAGAVLWLARRRKPDAEGGSEPPQR